MNGGSRESIYCKQAYRFQCAVRQGSHIELPINVPRLGAGTGHTGTIGRRPWLPPGKEGWTICDHRAILHSESYASADLGAAPDVDGQVWIVRGCVGLFAESDLTPTPGRRHLIDGGPSALGRHHRFEREKRPGQEAERPDDSADSAHARWLFGDHVKTDVHRLGALLRSHEHHLTFVRN